MKTTLLALLTLLCCMALAPMPAMGKVQGANLIASSQAPVQSIGVASQAIEIAPTVHNNVGDAALSLPISYVEPASKNSQAIAKATAAAVFEGDDSSDWHSIMKGEFQTR